MIRTASRLEKSVPRAICSRVATDQFLKECRVEPQNADQSIINIYGPGNKILGVDIIELGHGYFKGASGEPIAFVLLLGDELGNPRQLDFHGLADGLSMSELNVRQFVVL